MSYNKKTQATDNPNEWINWIDDAISNNSIKYYDYTHFNNIQEIGKGNFGKIYRASWGNTEQYYALKSFLNIYDVTVKELVYEVIANIFCFFFKYNVLYNLFL